MRGEGGRGRAGLVAPAPVGQREPGREGRSPPGCGCLWSCSPWWRTQVLAAYCGAGRNPEEGASAPALTVGPLSREKPALMRLPQRPEHKDGETDPGRGCSSGIRHGCQGGSPCDPGQTTNLLRASAARL